MTDREIMEALLAGKTLVLAHPGLDGPVRRLANDYLCDDRGRRFGWSLGVPEHPDDYEAGAGVGRPTWRIVEDPPCDFGEAMKRVAAGEAMRQSVWQSFFRVKASGDGYLELLRQDGAGKEPFKPTVTHVTAADWVPYRGGK